MKATRSSNPLQGRAVLAGLAVAIGLASGPAVRATTTSSPRNPAPSAPKTAPAGKAGAPQTGTPGAQAAPGTSTDVAPGGTPIDVAKYTQYVTEGHKAYVGGRFDDAVKSFALAVMEAEKPRTLNQRLAASLNNLAECYTAMKKYDMAEPLYKRSLDMLEKGLGPDHLEVAQSLNNFGMFYEKQGKLKEAEPLLVRSLKIKEKRVGADSVTLATMVNNLAGLYSSLGRYAEAEPYAKRAVEMLEKKADGTDSAALAGALHNIAILSSQLERNDEAEKYFRRSIDMMQKTLPPNDLTLASCHADYALLLAKLKRDSEAAIETQAAEAIRAKAVK
jgi:tetratricopeptide (TPR) repeat protein